MCPLSSFVILKTVNIKKYSTSNEPILIDINLPKLDFLFANLSPEEKVKLVDGEGHHVIVRIILKKKNICKVHSDTEVLPHLKDKLLCS